MITDPKTIRNAFDKILADPGALITPADYRAICDMRRIISAGKGRVGSVNPDQDEEKEGRCLK